MFGIPEGSSGPLGEAEDDGLVDADGLIDGLTDALGETDADTELDGDTDRLADADGEGDSDTDEDGLTLALGETEGDGEGDVDADGLIDGLDAEIDSHTLTPLVTPVSEYVWMQKVYDPGISAGQLNSALLSASGASRIGDSVSTPPGSVT
jgi:hypothetical protein